MGLDMERADFRGEIRVKSYRVLERAVEEGVRYGWGRAHKHTASPSAEETQDHIAREVMNAISEYFEFEETEP